jgi:hypothetical protein
LSATRRYLQDLLDEVRADLNEEADTAAESTNFWTDAFIVSRLNRGFRRVWQVAREQPDSPRFMRRLRSTDAPLILAGREFDPATLKLVTDMDEMKLPPDFAELHLLEPLVDADNTESGIIFHYTKLANDKFRVLIRTHGPSRGGVYQCEVVERQDGAYLLIAPKLSITDGTNIIMEYMFSPRVMEAGDALINTGFDDDMYDAVVAFTLLECAKKEGRRENVQLAGAAWQEASDFIKRSSGPTQRVEPERVAGYLEEECD